MRNYFVRLTQDFFRGRVSRPQTSSLTLRLAPDAVSRGSSLERQVLAPSRSLQTTQTSSLILRFLVVLGSLVVLGALVFIAWPLPSALMDLDGRLSLRVLDREGELLREIPSRREVRSVSLPLDAPIPGVLRDAFIASEDRRFEWHPGVDPVAVARAAAGNLRSGRVVSGASTIPQQLARLLVPRRRTLAGKLQEALWALRLSAHLPREDILRAYLD